MEVHLKVLGQWEQTSSQVQRPRSRTSWTRTHISNEKRLSPWLRYYSPSVLKVFRSVRNLMRRTPQDAQIEDPNSHEEENKNFLAGLICVFCGFMGIYAAVRGQNFDQYEVFLRMVVPLRWHGRSQKYGTAITSLLHRLKKMCPESRALVSLC